MNNNCEGFLFILVFSQKKEILKKQDPFMNEFQFQL